MAGMDRLRALTIAAAGVLGAAGVALAAVAAHKVTEPFLATAALFLILHAGGAVALSAAAAGAGRGGIFLAAAALMLEAGVLLFSGDLAMKALAGASLFPFAAPMGGSTMIAGWLVAAAGGVRGFKP